MKRILFLLSVVLLLTSCGDNDSDLQNADYSSLYDELVMEHTSLDSLSSLTNVPKESLVKMRFYLIDEDSDLTEKLREILIACRNKDKDKLNSIKDDKQDFDLTDKGSAQIERARKSKAAEIQEFAAVIEQKVSSNGYISEESYNMDMQKLHKMQQDAEAYFASLSKTYDDIRLKRNHKFGEKLPDIISDYVSEEVDGFIESKYTLFTAIPNTWKYYTKSDEDFAKDFLAELNTSDLGVKCESYYVQRVNNYKNVVCEESEIMGDELSIPDFSIIPGDSPIEIDSTLKNLVIERTKSQIKEISSDIFWDVIIVLIISFIISLIIDNEIDDAKKEAIDSFLRRVRWKKGDGFFKNLGKAILHGAGSYGEYEDKVNAIKAKYNAWKYIANICVFVISFVVTWFFFIIPQLRMEGDINAELTTKIIESSNTLNMNPERIINRYMNIGESYEANENEAIPDEEIVVEADTCYSPDYFVDMPKSIYILLGKIGNNDVKVNLTINNSTKEISGDYIYLKNGKPYSAVLNLNGRYNEQCNTNVFTLDETTQEGLKCASWNGTLEFDEAGAVKMKGQLTNSKNQKFDFEINSSDD